MIVFENPIYFFALLLIPLKYLIVKKYTSKNTASITVPSIELFSKDLINSGKKTYFIFSLNKLHNNFTSNFSSCKT